MMNLQSSPLQERRLNCWTQVAAAWLAPSDLRKKSTRSPRHSASVFCCPQCAARRPEHSSSQTVSAAANRLLRIPTVAPCPLPRSSVISFDNILKRLAIGESIHLRRDQIKSPRHVK